MKQRITAVSLALCFLATAAFAAGPEIGTWKLNESKSQLGGGSKNTKVVYQEAGDQWKVTVWSVDPKGNKGKNEWKGKPDGKFYPVTGDAWSDSRSLKKVSANTYSLVSKKGGKTVGTGKIVYAKDGKSRTVTVSGTGPDGKKFKSTAFYDKS